jgi:hypothetical protein
MLLWGSENMLSFRVNCTKTLFDISVDVDAKRRMPQNNHDEEHRVQAIHSQICIACNWSKRFRVRVNGFAYLPPESTCGLAFALG